mmetsp:Transcript_45870/g.118678  ORF Transcript_45870/g.118678 Transcript_45870/m.118678 type:complete len:226 (-) Transcript_45870:1316-1993(-)
MAGPKPRHVRGTVRFGQLRGRDVTCASIASIPQEAGSPSREHHRQRLVLVRCIVRLLLCCCRLGVALGGQLVGGPAEEVGLLLGRLDVRLCDLEGKVGQQACRGAGWSRHGGHRDRGGSRRRINRHGSWHRSNRHRSRRRGDRDRRRGRRRDDGGGGRRRRGHRRCGSRRGSENRGWQTSGREPHPRVRRHSIHRDTLGGVHNKHLTHQIGELRRDSHQRLVPTL